MIYFLAAYVIVPLLVLAVVIFVHEFGHFAVARYFKVPVPVFSVGFGREIFGFHDRYGTRWKFSLFPLGGYVKIDESDQRPLYQRTLITLAGPFANFGFSVGLLFLVFLFYGAPVTPPDIVGVNLEGGAYEAGILPRDTMRTIHGLEVPKDMDDIKSVIRGIKERTTEVVVRRDGRDIPINVALKPLKKSGDFGEDDSQPMLGVVFAGQNLKLSAINRVGDIVTEGNLSAARAEILKHAGQRVVINFGEGKDRGDFLVFIDGLLNAGLTDESSSDYANLVLWDYRNTRFYPLSFFQSVTYSVDLLYQGIKKTVGVLYQIVVGKKDTHDLGGVVAISSMSGEVAEKAMDIGPYFIFKLLALLSINIGFLNLLPFPMLDGGHLAFYAVEAIRGRPPSPKVKGYIYGFGILFIFWVIGMANYHDVIEKMGL